MGLPFNVHLIQLYKLILGSKESFCTGLQRNVEFLSILIFTCILFPIIHGAAAVFQRSEKLMEKTQCYCLQASISKAYPKEQLT